MKCNGSSRRITVIALACALLGAWLLVTADGWTLGSHALWTFSFLIFVPLPLRLLLAIGLCGIGLWSFNCFAFPAHLTLPTLHPALRWLIVPLSGLIFWLLREHTLYGDGEYKLKLLATQTLQTDAYVWKEPLDSLVAYSLTALLRPLPAAPVMAEGLMSVAAGMLYVAAVLSIADKVGKTRADVRMQKLRYQPLFFILGLLALGSSQLWFGHIENYSFVTATSFAASALAIGYLAGQTPLWLVGLATGFAVSFHPQAAFGAPALLFVLKRRQWPRQVITLFLSGLAGPLLTIGALRLAGVPWPDLTNGYAGNHQLFFTLTQALAPAQLGQAWNNLWLVAPLAPLWLMAGGWGVTKPSMRQDACFRYLTAVALGFLVYHFTFRNELPRHQDWDLFAIVGPSVTLWGLYVWLRLLALDVAEGLRCDLTALTTTLLAFAVLLTAAWIGVNHVYTLIQPTADQRALYQRYRLLDLREQLAQATITPNTPICTAAQGCERVAALSFTMPQNGDERPVIFAHAPVRVEFRLQVPAQATFLWLSPALDPVAWNWGGDGVEFRISVKHDGQEDLLWSRFLTPAQPADRAWQKALAPLTAYRGQTVTLVLATLPGPADNTTGDRAGWGMPWLMLGTPDTRFEQ